MSRRIDKTTIPFLENAGYGKGSNFTVDAVASLMLQYADSLVKNIKHDALLVGETKCSELVCSHKNTEKVGCYKDIWCKDCNTMIKSGM